MAIEMTNELRGKLIVAQGEEEVRAILAEAGQEATAEEVERIVAEIAHAAEHDGEGLSLDELDAVAGGGWMRDYREYGCAATVEPGSDCWGTDGGCAALHNTYLNKPVNVKCSCGHYMYKDVIEVRPNGEFGVLICPYCKSRKEAPVEVYRALVAY